MALDSLTIIHTLISLIGIAALVAQLFNKVPFLHRLAPKGEEPPFAIAQGVVMVIFIWLGIRAFRNFHPGRARTA